MNRKTIEKILTRKHLSLMKSIDDEEVRRIFDKEAIITGGAIASMMLNEKVNDYDYYFTSKDACLKVANYYVAKFLKENKGNVKVQPSVIDEDDRVRIEIRSVGMVSESDKGDYNPNVTLNGEGEDFVEGMLNAVTEGDSIDSRSMAKAQPDNRKPYRVIFMTSNAITLSDDVQLVMRFHGNPDEIHENYDFAHCTNYWQSKDSKVHLRADAMESLLSKHLCYQGSLYPICSIIRTRKFIKRGWHINAGQYLKMVFQANELDLTNMTVLQDQLIGVDTAYFQQLIDIIKAEQKGNPSFSLDANYISSIIDKIF